MTVDIISSVLDGAEFLPEFLRSLQDQTHRDWRLWLRDDGSSDASVDIARSFAASDDRIRLLHVGGPRLGIVGAYGWTLERVPPDSAYVMVGDVDDVWLPHKIARTLQGMQEAERSAPPGTPLLVHTDLTVVDRELRVVHPSYWEFSGVNPEPATLRRVIVCNVATAPTVMMNRALRETIGATPPGALYQDWWYTLVASALGRVVAIREPTVLYRQHGANAGGNRARATRALNELPGVVARRLGAGGVAQFRKDLSLSAIQARALLDRYGERLSPADRDLVRRFARIPERSFLLRKADLLRLRVLPEHGVLQRLGILLRG